MKTITLEKIKQFGKYMGFDEISKQWIYLVGNQYFVINRNGSFKVA